MKSLNELVAQAESIATNLEDDEIPHIQRSIDQLRQRGGQYSFNRGSQNDINAAKLLGNKVGYELSAGLSKTIESLQILSAYDGGSETNIVDIPGFLKNERETAILSSINMTRTNTATENYKRSESARSEWWNIEKNKILGLLSSGDKLPHIVDSCVQRGVIRPGIEAQVSGRLGRDETSYARQVAIFVDSAVCEAPVRQSPRLHELILEAETSPMKSSKCAEMAELARLLSSYCKISNVTNMADQRQSEGELSRQMVNIALNHLETELSNYIKQCVDAFSPFALQNPRKVLVSFLETQMLPHFTGKDGVTFEDGSICGVPVWPLIYLCLRAGYIEEAVEVANEAKNNIGDWYLWLNEFMVDGKISSDHSRKIITDYKRYVRGSSDGCKRLVYCLVGGCDIEDNHPQVLISVDDFMWCRLFHLRRSYSGHDNLNLSLNKSRQSLEHQSLLQLQRLISEDYGETHFQAQQQPVTFCKVLLLCQLLEPAIAFLARFDHLRCHAVHAALVLWHQGLLLVPDDIKTPLLTRHDQDAVGLVRLNLARLVTMYTRPFESVHPKETLDLFFLLSCNLPSIDNEDDPFVTLASSLVLEDGNLDLLLGTCAFGNSSSGLLSRYGRGVRDSVLDIVVTRLAESGRGEAAADTLQLAGRLPEAAVLLADILASSLSLPGNHPEIDARRLQSKADMLLRSMSSSCPEANILSRVLDIVSFMSLCNQGDIDAALIALDSTGLLPSTMEPGRVRSSLEEFRGLPEIVRSLVPIILVTAMRLVRFAATTCRRDSPDSMVDIRRRASALITFTGQLPYRMPADIYASLSQLELDIN